MTRSLIRIVLSLSLLTLLCAVPAAADWLVGLDGGRIETRGPWKVKRSTVVFTAADGTLSSLRLADVDLEASGRATAEAKTPAPAAHSQAASALEPAKRAPVMVLTTEDVGGSVEPAREPESEDQTGGARSAEDPAAEVAVEPPPIQVIAWRQVESPNRAGLEIRGTLRNDSTGMVGDAGVKVSLFDSDGELIARRDAFLDAVAVTARSTIGFRALFPGVDHFDGEPVFEVRARELKFSTDQ